MNPDKNISKLLHQMDRAYSRSTDVLQFKESGMVSNHKNTLFQLFQRAILLREGKFVSIKKLRRLTETIPWILYRYLTVLIKEEPMREEFHQERFHHFLKDKLYPYFYKKRLIHNARSLRRKNAFHQTRK